MKDRSIIVSLKSNREQIDLKYRLIETLASKRWFNLLKTSLTHENCLLNDGKILLGSFDEPYFELIIQPPNIIELECEAEFTLVTQKNTLYAIYDNSKKILTSDLHFSFAERELKGSSYDPTGDDKRLFKVAELEVKTENFLEISEALDVKNLSVDGSYFNVSKAIKYTEPKLEAQSKSNSSFRFKTVVLNTGFYNIDEEFGVMATGVSLSPANFVVAHVNKIDSLIKEFLDEDFLVFHCAGSMVKNYAEFIIDLHKTFDEMKLNAIPAIGELRFMEGGEHKPFFDLPFLILNISEYKSLGKPSFKEGKLNYKFDSSGVLRNKFEANWVGPGQKFSTEGKIGNITSDLVGEIILNGKKVFTTPLRLERNLILQHLYLKNKMNVIKEEVEFQASSEKNYTKLFQTSHEEGKRLEKSFQNFTKLVCFDNSLDSILFSNKNQETYIYTDEKISRTFSRLIKTNQNNLLEEIEKISFDGRGKNYPLGLLEAIFSSWGVTRVEFFERLLTSRVEVIEFSEIYKVVQKNIELNTCIYLAGFFTSKQLRYKSSQNKVIKLFMSLVEEVSNILGDEVYYCLEKFSIRALQKNEVKFLLLSRVVDDREWKLSEQ